MSKASNLLTDSQTLAVTAWQWLKLEWPWAVPAILLALLLGVCVRIIKKRRHAGVDEQDSTSQDVLQDGLEKEFMAPRVLEVSTVDVDANDRAEEEESRTVQIDREEDVEKTQAQVARDQRIRDEIEALHRARVEQRQRIESRTVDRSEGRRQEENRSAQTSRYSTEVATLILPRLAETATQLKSEAKGDRVTSQTEMADDFRFITNLFDDPAPEVRNLAARALYNLQSDRAASFTRALRDGSPERRRRIGAALAASGLATEALANLAGQNLDKAYDAFSVLFLMAKAGEVDCLINVIEHGPNLEVRLAVVKLLALGGQSEVVTAFRRLAVRSSLPAEVRSAVMEAIHQIGTQ